MVIGKEEMSLLCYRKEVWNKSSLEFEINKKCG